MSGLPLKCLKVAGFGLSNLNFPQSSPLNMFLLVGFFKYLVFGTGSIELLSKSMLKHPISNDQVVKSFFRRDCFPFQNRICQDSSSNDRYAVEDF